MVNSNNHSTCAHHVLLQTCPSSVSLHHILHLIILKKKVETDKLWHLEK